MSLPINTLVSNHSAKAYDELFRDLGKKNYNTLTKEEKLQFDGKVQQFMAEMEILNKNINRDTKFIASRAKKEEDFAEKASEIASASEQFKKGTGEGLKTKEVPIEPQASPLEVIRKEIQEVRDLLTKKPQKDDDWLTKAEKMYQFGTKQERKAITREIQNTFGQSTLSKIGMKATKVAYDAAKKGGILPKNELRDDAIEMVYELNDLRNDMVKTAKDLVNSPVTTIRKYVESEEKK